jgi:hypothetical protein
MGDEPARSACATLASKIRLSYSFVAPRVDIAVMFLLLPALILGNITCVLLPNMLQGCGGRARAAQLLPTLAGKPALNLRCNAPFEG